MLSQYHCFECGSLYESQWLVTVGRCRPCSDARRAKLSAIRKNSSIAVARAKKAGLLPILSVVYVPCIDCGERAHDYDHRDYDRPLDVQPVCRRCNIRRGPAKQIAEIQAASPSRPRVTRAITGGDLAVDPAMYPSMPARPLASPIAPSSDAA